MRNLKLARLLARDAFDRVMVTVHGNLAWLFRRCRQLRETPGTHRTRSLAATRISSVPFVVASKQPYLTVSLMEARIGNPLGFTG